MLARNLERLGGFLVFSTCLVLCPGATACRYSAKAAENKAVAAKDNRKILDFTLGESSIADVERVLGQTKRLETTETGPLRICYASTDASGTAINFEAGAAGGWEVLTGFRLFRSASNDSACKSSEAITPGISTRSGLRLGLTMVEIKAILGPPCESGADFLRYRSVLTTRRTAEELARLREMRDYSHSTGEDIDRMTLIEFEFTDSKLTSVKVTYTETD